MRNPDRIDIITKELAEIWKTVPDLRLGQMLLNVWPDPVIYYVEDEEMIKMLKKIYMKEEGDK